MKFRYVLWVAGAIVSLLAQRPGRVLTKAELAAHLGYEGSESASNLLEVHISHARKKIDEGFAVPLVRTVRGRGYALGEQAS